MAEPITNYVVSSHAAFIFLRYGANPPRCSRVWSEEVIDFTDRFIRSPPMH
jgi:hypothetical protein